MENEVSFADFLKVYDVYGFYTLQKVINEKEKKKKIKDACCTDNSRILYEHIV